MLKTYLFYCDIAWSIIYFVLSFMYERHSLIKLLQLSLFIYVEKPHENRSAFKKRIFIFCVSIKFNFKFKKSRAILSYYKN